ncbi:MAG: hypothetical protein NVS1B7_7620 [Candidatus Saccharimonadales bacterium]
MSICAFTTKPDNIVKIKNKLSARESKKNGLDFLTKLFELLVIKNVVKYRKNHVISTAREKSNFTNNGVK